MKEFHGYKRVNPELYKNNNNKDSSMISNEFREHGVNNPLNMKPLFVCAHVFIL
jgi:hypothetical protein